MPDYDVAVVGSGFGGSVAALRLSEKGYSVGVFEAGRRFRAEDFPRTNWNVRRFLFFPRLGMRGIQRLTLLRDVLVLSGAGVGGGSLVFANTLYEPLPAFYQDPQWAGITDWEDELAPHYEQARRMLGATATPITTPADEVMAAVADRLGVSDTYHPTSVGIYFGEPGVEADDPYFGGAGPSRSGCTNCGGCMVGCRHGAKNTLDRNYLHLAEGLGATIHPESEVVDVEAEPGGGFRLTVRRPGSWLPGRSHRRTFTAGQVVLAAGVLGTLRLLFRLRDGGRLPQVSDRLGHLVRTNSEAIVGATADTADVDYSSGVAITSSIHPEPHTHIEPVRYPAGSNLMGLLGTVLVDGGGRLPRQLRFLGQIARHPARFARSLSVRRWSERTIILLVMQSRNNSLLVRPRRRLGGLTSDQGTGEPNPTYIPMANRAARITAELIGGQPSSSLNEVVLNVPTTAHILGGACIGSSPAEGVIDPWHRLFGHPGVHVVDGAAVSANLGVNPSLTITALAERAMSLWPNKGEADERPPTGSGYRRVAPVRPHRPAVPPSAPGALCW